MSKDVFSEKNIPVTPNRIKPHPSERKYFRLTEAQLNDLDVEAREKYITNVDWMESQIRYLKDTITWLKRHKRYEMPDTYDNNKKTESRLTQLLKFASEWFNEIWRWFPLTQFKALLIRNIVKDAIDKYITTVPLPYYSYEKGLTEPPRVINITITEIKTEFKEI